MIIKGLIVLISAMAIGLGVLYWQYGAVKDDLAVSERLRASEAARADVAETTLTVTQIHRMKALEREAVKDQEIADLRARKDFFDETPDVIHAALCSIGMQRSCDRISLSSNP